MKGREENEKKIIKKIKKKERNMKLIN